MTTKLSGARKRFLVTLRGSTQHLRRAIRFTRTERHCISMAFIIEVHVTFLNLANKCLTRVGYLSTRGEVLSNCYSNATEVCLVLSTTTFRLDHHTCGTFQLTLCSSGVCDFGSNCTATTQKQGSLTSSTPIRGIVEAAASL